MEDFFKNKKPNFDKLKTFGFINKSNVFVFEKFILDNEFKVIVKISKNGVIKTETIETFSKEPYTLHLVEGAKGTFIGQVRKEYENVLEEIAEKCFDVDLYSSETTKQVIKYLQEKYGNEPEFLWENFPTYCIFRNNNTKKWYAVIGTISKNKIDKSLISTDTIEIINLRASKEDVPELIKQDNIYPGWHMNKKSWITIILDGSMNTEEIVKYIDESYNFAKRG